MPEISRPMPEITRPAETVPYSTIQKHFPNYGNHVLRICGNQSGYDQLRRMASILQTPYLAHETGRRVSGFVVQTGYEPTGLEQYMVGYKNPDEIVDEMETIGKRVKASVNNFFKYDYSTRMRINNGLRDPNAILELSDIVWLTDTFVHTIARLRTIAISPGVTYEQKQANDAWRYNLKLAGSQGRLILPQSIEEVGNDFEHSIELRGQVTPLLNSKSENYQIAALLPKWGHSVNRALLDLAEKQGMFSTIDYSRMS